MMQTEPGHSVDMDKTLTEKAETTPTAQNSTRLAREAKASVTQGFYRNLNTGSNEKTEKKDTNEKDKNEKKGRAKSKGKKTDETEKLERTIMENEGAINRLELELTERNSKISEQDKKIKALATLTNNLKRQKQDLQKIADDLTEKNLALARQLAEKNVQLQQKQRANKPSPAEQKHRKIRRLWKQSSSRQKMRTRNLW